MLKKFSLAIVAIISFILGFAILVSSCGGSGGGGGTTGGSSNSYPSPANGAIDVSTNPTLQWAAVPGATGYNVYFDVTSTGWTSLINTTGTVFTPTTTLTFDSKYYWRIDSISGITITQGTVWSFTTKSAWTRQFGTAAEDIPCSIVRDSAGNFYIAGTTEGNLDGTNNGQKDIFVTKYNSVMTRLWTNLIGSTGNDYANDIAIDASGNVYVAGQTAGNMDGAINAGGFDAVLIKINSSGIKQWTRQFGTASDDQANGVAVDASGNIYVVGQTLGSLGIYTNSGMNDVFIVKYNPGGSLMDTKQFGTSSDDVANKAVVDSSGNLYLVGYTSGGLDGVSNAGFSDAFIKKYNSSGIAQWTYLLGTSGNDIGVDITLDASGNIYVSGNTEGTFFGSINQGGRDGFAAKCSSANGVPSWISQFGTSSDENVKAITLDSSNNSYVVGYTNFGGNDAFISKLNSGGINQWFKQFGSAATDAAEGVATDSSYIYITGETFGGIDNKTLIGSSDIFIAKYDTAGNRK